MTCSLYLFKPIAIDIFLIPTGNSKILLWRDFDNKSSKILEEYSIKKIDYEYSYILKTEIWFILSATKYNYVLELIKNLL